jgi:hypothetical protein
MNFLDSTINITTDDKVPSPEELAVIKKVLTEEWEVPEELFEAFQISRMSANFFYTLYVIPLEGSVLYLKMSPHKDIVNFNDLIAAGFQKGKKKRKTLAPIGLSQVCKGEIVKDLYYTLDGGYDGFPLAQVQPNDPLAMHTMFLGLTQTLQDHDFGDELHDQEKVYGDFFNCHTFREVLPLNYQGRFLRLFKEIGETFIQDVADTCRTIFVEDVLSKHAADGNCLGPLREQDVCVGLSTSCPFISFAPAMHRGSMAVDLALVPWEFNIGTNTWINILKNYEDAQQFAQPVDDIINLSWIPMFYYAFVDEILFHTLGTHFYGTSQVANSAKYQRMRGFLSNNEHFKPFVDNLDKIFLEKLLN